MPPSSEAVAKAHDQNMLGLPPHAFQSIMDKTDTAWSTIAETPCTLAPKLSAIAGCDLYVKYENTQYTGSFKERGALAKILALSAEERKAGVIAASAGNHAQGLARHAALQGIKAIIVMPTNTPTVKVEETRRLGADVILHGENYDDASAFAQEKCRKDSLTYVHPFDDPYVCAGQGTIAAEMLQAVPDLDTLVVPIGGGGLIAGMASVAAFLKPEIKIIGVQSMLYPGMIDALAGHGRRGEGGSTLAEGIAVLEPGRLTRHVVRQLVTDIVTVDEAQLERALSLLLTQQKTLAEGAGAAGLAAVLGYPALFRGQKVGTVLCGGNIDSRLLSSILMRDLARQRRLARLRITLIDVPGQLTRVSEAIGDAGGNVIDISYHKIFNDLPAKQTHLDISVEAHDGLHMDRIIERLRADGLSVEIANY